MFSMADEHVPQYIDKGALVERQDFAVSESVSGSFVCVFVFNFGVFLFAGCAEQWEEQRRLRLNVETILSLIELRKQSKP